MIKLQNYARNEQTVDRLLAKQKNCDNTRCTEKLCLGSLMSFKVSETGTGKPRPVEKIQAQAKEFFDEYYTSLKRFRSVAHKERWDAVVKELRETGTYALTGNELHYGAKLAWRNAVRCIMRIQWGRLQIFDARNVTNAAGMYEALLRHIKYATNGGNIRSAMTIFPQRTDGLHDFRVWNQGLFSWAGYVNEDGTITGDAGNVEFTEQCLKLGWVSKRTRWDLLPIVVSANGEDPEWFEIPEDCRLIVPIVHPTLDFVKDMDLKWYALPAVSSMLLDAGGIEFTAIPFNGWYMVTEIGARDLTDPQRYNILPEFATKMGLDTTNSTTLWKDKALVELNIAVLHSFQKAGVTMVDHHTASETFMKHYENEINTRGGCPSDWVWLVPPMSGSLSQLYHQEMVIYHMKPSYEYQVQPWKTHVWKKHREGDDVVAKKKKTFKELAKAVIFSSHMYTKALAGRTRATILFATETGRSELFARKLKEKFSHAFNAKLLPMHEYDIANIEQESLLLIVASTFGNGDPPENGESFSESLHKLKGGPGSAKGFLKEKSEVLENKPTDITSFDISKLGCLKNTAFAVFGLGSKAYPNFCAFGKYVDNVLSDLGGQRVIELGCGDELNGQESTFRTWSSAAYKAACDHFCLDAGAEGEVPATFVISTDTVRLFPSAQADGRIKGLSKLHNREIALYELARRTELNKEGAERTTIKVELAAEADKQPLTYSAGDHIAIMPNNRAEYVEAILGKLVHKPPADKPIQLQTLEVKTTAQGIQKTWVPHERLPCVTLKNLLTRYLDITTPPRPDLLAYFAKVASDENEKKTLEKLSTDNDEYEHWKNSVWPDLARVLTVLFPSISADAAVLSAMLPTLQPRFYSVSSSSLAHYNEFHLTVAVVTYNVIKGGGEPLHYGVASNFLKDIEIGAKVPVFVRNAASFHMPSDDSQPIIMVGPGTGIAPFRGFWQERAVKKTREAKDYGKLSLYFGCQTRDSYLHEKELETMTADGVLDKVFLALSRDPNTKKTYVQNKIEEEGADVVKQLLEQNGHVYICGDIKMSHEVIKTIEKLLTAEGKMSEEEAKKFMLSLHDQNRLHEDIFGITHTVSQVVEQVHAETKSRIEAK